MVHAGALGAGRGRGLNSQDRSTFRSTRIAVEDRARDLFPAFSDDVSLGAEPLLLPGFVFYLPYAHFLGRAVHFAKYDGKDGKRNLSLNGRGYYWLTIKVHFPLQAAYR
jgi:hypothetical protein